MHNHPSKLHIALLDIKAIIRKWQDLDISDRVAMDRINSISIELQKEEWKDGHK